MKDKRNQRKWANLFVVRHGESTCNEVNRFAGAIDVPLTPLGEAQAREAARLWDGPPPEIVFTSPLQRARRTAAILVPDAGPAANAPIRQVVDERLTERHFGDFTLRNKAFLQGDAGLRRYEAALYGDGVAPPNAEPFRRFHGRVLEFLREVLHPLLLAGKRVLVVAHKYVIELLCRMILRLPAGNGYDLRLPNGKVIAGTELRAYLGRESKAANLLREWIVLRHAFILAGSAAAGIFLGSLRLLPRMQPLLPLALLALATGISLTRVDLRGVRDAPAPGALLLRYVLLPLAATGLAGPGGTVFFFLALLLAAPSAITGITISRCLGGMVAPTVQALLFSTVSGTVMILSILGAAGGSLLAPGARLLAVSGLGLGVPILTAAVMRRRFPIGTAKFGERNGATAVLLLSLFVLLSFAGIRLKSGWPAGGWAVLLAFGLRLLALALARRGSLFAVDHYVSMSYPNIFLVIVFAAMMGWEEVAAMATWFLLPMFTLAPLDEWLCRKFLSPKADARLLAFLGITAPAAGVLQARRPGTAKSGPYPITR